MIPKRIQRVKSRAAAVSKALGICSMLGFIVMALMHKSGMLQTAGFLAALSAVWIVAIVGVFAALLGFRSLWRDGKEGGHRSMTGLLLSLAVLSPLAFAGYKSATLPRLNDISTDLPDPPIFEGQTAPRLNAELQAKAYPQVTGRRYELSAELIAAAIEELVASEGWRVLNRTGNLAGAKEFQIEAESNTLLFGFKDLVAIRVTDEERSAFVDMRSQSGFGDADLGANAARIVKFLDALDEKVAKEAGSQVKP
jgi:uncharacterized protein (DUF1499 family)